MRSSAEIRQTFLDFFAERGHRIVPSSSLVPANDPSLLFTNAGMVQFKEVFLGLEERPYRRAASVQRCVRAGGKHNDLENVGYTARHHTFFEMLGNFSFGDYFKREAIRYAWELLTGVFEIPPERLWVTVYAEDDEAADIWLREIGVDPARFSRIGDKPGGRRYESDNFWSMGDTGPCGPCTEIFYDHGPEVPGGPPGSPGEEGDRYIEIWNLVFMQYDRDAEGNLKPLPRPSVDTGMGLERLAAVLQGVHSNYEIDLFRNLIRAAAELLGVEDQDSPSLKVIADHIRACSFLITDGVLPANEGRGYVLRRIIRRAARHGHKLGAREPFFYRLVPALVHEMGDAYPELARAAEQVQKVLRLEEERFAETLDKGMAILRQAIEAARDGVIPGETVFRLYDTYGFPADLTADVAREHGLRVDMAGFERHMAEQRQRARAASAFADLGGETPVAEQGWRSEFIGYDHLQGEAQVIGLLRDGQPVESLAAGEEGMVVLDRTPFYAESGGQVGDTGVIRSDSAEFQVTDTQKQGQAIVHIGRLAAGSLRVGERVQAVVDAVRREAIRAHHSATHLLHAALRQVLGEHVQQKGSLVTADRLRFDFSHFEPLTPEQISEVEEIVNREIRRNAAAEAREMSMEEALREGAMALFGEKYGERVRVMKIGFSTELCGGTHVDRAGDIGLFKIINETGVAAGVRRIEAVVGEAALRWIEAEERQLREVARLVRTDPQHVADKVGQLLATEKALEKELARLKAKLAAQAGRDLAGQAVDVHGVRVVAAQLEGADAKALREIVDRLKNQLGHAVIVLASSDGKKVSLVAGVTRGETDRIRAGELVNWVAQQVGGRGGGRPDMAQAGGNDPAALPQALAGVVDWVRARLGETVAG